jgi:hypothetical protein
VKLVTAPALVILPIDPIKLSGFGNQTAPSDPAAIPNGPPMLEAG